MSAEWAEEPAAPTPAVATHPGAQLKAAREALGWTVEQVAEQLKLARRQVIALEAGDHAALPGAVVVRGFIRAYAKIVKIDATPLVAMIEPDPPEPLVLQPAPREKKATFSETRFPNMGDRPFPFGLLIGAVVLVGAGFGAYKFGLVPVHLPAASTPAAEAVAPAEPAVAPVETTLLKADQELSTVKPAPSAVDMPAATPVAEAPAAAAAAATPAAKADAAKLEPAKTEAPKTDAAKPTPATTAAVAANTNAPAAQAPAAVPAAAKPGANALVFTAKGDSWVEVRSAATDKPLFRRLMKAGSTDFVEVTEPVNVVVGKPEEVSATLRGAAVELKPVTGGTTARLSLK